MPTMCTHGRCMNTPGSFECQCDHGFIYDQDSHQCIDENECQQVRLLIFQEDPNLVLSSRRKKAKLLRYHESLRNQMMNSNEPYET